MHLRTENLPQFMFYEKSKTKRVQKTGTLNFRVPHGLLLKYRAFILCCLKILTVLSPRTGAKGRNKKSHET